MAKECRNLGEFFDGPDDAKNPDDAATGKVAKIWAQARDEGAEHLKIEVRTTPTGTTSSEQLIVTFAKVTDDPTSAAHALRMRIEDELPATFSGQLRINVSNRTTNEHLGSHTRVLRPALEVTTSLPSGAGPVHSVLREPEAVRPWADLVFRMFSTAPELFKAAADLVRAQHAPPPNNTAAALLQAFNGIASNAKSGPQPGQSQAPQPGAGGGGQMDYPVAWGSLPWSPTGPPVASLPADGSISTVSPNNDTSRSRDVTEEDVIKWAKENPDRTRALVLKAMAAQ